jgi:hypothetical protein
MRELLLALRGLRMSYGMTEADGRIVYQNGYVTEVWIENEEVVFSLISCRVNRLEYDKNVESKPALVRFPLLKILGCTLNIGSAFGPGQNPQLEQTVTFWPESVRLD